MILNTARLGSMLPNFTNDIRNPPIFVPLISDSDTQIREKRYHEAFWKLGKPLVGVGVSFSSATGNIVGWEMAEMDGGM